MVALENQVDKFLQYSYIFIKMEESVDIVPWLQFKR